MAVGEAGEEKAVSVIGLTLFLESARYSFSFSSRYLCRTQIMQIFTGFSILPDICPV